MSMLSNILADIGETLREYLSPERQPGHLEFVREYKASTFLQQAQAFFRLPVQIERYFRIWLAYAVYSTASFLVYMPMELFWALAVNPLLGLLGLSPRHLGFSVLAVLSLYVVTRDWLVFDISFLYHSFRGQSTLKFYGLLFAFEVSEKLLTMVGAPVLSTFGQQPRETTLAERLKVSVCALLYLLAHTFSIYLEYVVFIVVINSQRESFLIYIFVMNLTKMKSTAFKKFDERAYRAQINYDMKDRMQKVVYLVLFCLSQSNRTVDSYYFKLTCVFVVGMLVEWVKHATVLGLSEKRLSIDELTRGLLRDTGRTRKGSVLKSIELDYTVLPLATFILKMAFTIHYTRNSPVHLMNFVPTAVAICLYLLVVPFLRQLYEAVAQAFATDDDDDEEFSDGD